jgi:hypothetical protein
MRRERKHTGPFLASLAAGPVFVLTIYVQRLAEHPAWFDDEYWAMPVIGLLAVAVGTFLAAVPNVVAYRIMYRVGRTNEGSRLPVFWALTGGLFAGSFSFWIDAPEHFVIAFVVTGVTCALICRAEARWP